MKGITEREIIGYAEALDRKNYLGDDSAFVKLYKKDVLITTDTLTEGIHFERRYFPPEFLGWKSLAVNISDICAMGGRADSFLLSVSFPEDIKRAFVRRFFRGINTGMKRYRLTILGGNTSASPVVSITVTMIGFVSSKNNVVYRSGAMPGELVYVSGRTGLSAKGLRMLKAMGYKRAIRRFKNETLSFLMPEPPQSFSFRCAEKGLFTSMIDLSDGLAQGILEICKRSRIGMDIFLKDDFLKGVDVDDVLYGGEDYTLLFTIKEKNKDAIERIARDTKTFPFLIGNTTHSRIRVFTKDGVSINLQPQRAFQHFK